MRTYAAASMRVGFALVLAVTGLAGDVYVTPGGPGPSPFNSWATAASDIQSAVTAATANDTIWISNGVYALTAAIVVSKNLSFVGVPASDPPTIDGQATVRCFSNTPAARMVLDHLRLVNGSGASGGGVYMYRGEIRDCVLSNHVATTSGGGLYIAGSGTVERTTFANNMAGVNGGGLYAMTSPYLRLDGCLVAGNRANTQGGGLYFYNVTGLTAVACDVRDNTAPNSSAGGVFVNGPASGTTNRILDTRVAGNASGGSGGGVWVLAAGNTCAITDCIITNNTATNAGGGLLIQCAAMVRDCLVVNNRQTPATDAATRGGGGVNVSDGGQLINCRIEGNSSVYTGGGVYMNGANALLRNCLIRNNQCTGTATYGGGGIRFRYATGNQVENCSVVGNYAARCGGGVDIRAASDQMINCIIYSNTCAQASYNNYYVESTPAISNCCFTPALAAANDDLAANNITAAPLFSDAAYRVRHGSLTIDAGTNLSWMSSATDLDGDPRIDSSGRVDMGCYECNLTGTVLMFR